MAREWILIFLGGGGGALSRRWLSVWAERLSAGLNFPLGILLCNVLGSLLMGVISGYLAGRPDTARWAGPLLLVGFMGAFTTFSTFARDSMQLLTQGQSLTACINIMLSVGLSLVAVFWGLRLGAC